ncbi:insulinase family protein [Aminipila butyrica]|uniref:Insulinase family protein n=1 Tax=Aminipila butyrica TaxID=433296 RepID=A0A858BWL5_9FIRM|nr:pitrilysin family protein [Aminipila butyrica]QIB69498.1 insulinase family protein [Aminipila butyrica]
MIETKKLDCGIRIVMEQIPHVQSVALGIWVKAGSVDETTNISGISHFIEHMMFKGTNQRSAKKIAEDVDRIGGQINAFTGREATCYYMKTLSSNAEEAAEILLDMFLNSTFDEEEMNKEKKVIYEEMKMIEDTPDDYAHEMISDLIFKGSIYENSIIGTRDTLKGISRSILKQYVDQEYTRDSIVISIAGNVEMDKMCQFFEGRLKHLKAEKAHKPYRDQAYEPRFQVKVKEIEQTHICMGTRGLPLEDENYYALALLSNIMGGSMSSRLFQNIREQKGLAYSVYSHASSYVKSGYYNIYAGVSHDKIAEAIQGIKEELELLKTQGITEDELHVAKEQLKASYIFGQENVNGRMFSTGKNSILLDRIYTPEEVIGEIDRVTMEDMKKASSLIHNIENYSAVMVTNKEWDLKQLMQA